jgi:hypothetical protein
VGLAVADREKTTTDYKNNKRPFNKKVYGRNLR